jgi:hypothetical protein
MGGAHRFADIGLQCLTQRAILVGHRPARLSVFFRKGAAAP